MKPVTALMLLLCTGNLPAQAQVFEVGDDGNLTMLAASTLTPVDATTPSIDNPVVAAKPIPARYRQAVLAAADRYALSPWLIDAVARSESGYDADAVSPAGAIGIMQLMPETARELGVDPHDPAQNIFGGAAYLRHMLDRFDGSVELALAAYNAGSGNVLRHGGVPPFRETRDYVRRNLERLATAAANDVLAANTPAATNSPSYPYGGMP